MFSKSPGTWLRQEHILSAHPTVTLQGAKEDLPSPWKQSHQVDRMQREGQANWKLTEESIRKVPTLYAYTTIYPRPKTLTRASTHAAPHQVAVPLRHILRLFKVPVDNKFKLAHWMDALEVTVLVSDICEGPILPWAQPLQLHVFNIEIAREYQNENLPNLLQYWQ